MDDKHDILFRRNTLCGKINNVMCFFCQLNPVVKLRLMCRFCSDHYGGVLWDLNNPSVENVHMPGAKDLDVHMISLDALILCLYQLYVDFFH